MRFCLWIVTKNNKNVIRKMSLFNAFRPERNKQKLDELKVTLQFNPEYFKEVEKIKVKRDGYKAYM
jgi:hypothetical protein